MSDISDKKAPKSTCEICDYSSNNLSHFKRHCLTKKHQLGVMNSKNSDKSCHFGTKKHICECGKEYKYRQGLSYHRKRCNKNSSDIANLKNEILELKNELMEKAIEENNELKRIINAKDEQIKQLIPKVGNQVTFNINNFLNDKCKDAINLEEFVKSITVSVENLMLTHDEGLSAGISNIIMENINKLSLHERPIHCSDKKREILYIKNGTWEKDKNKCGTKNMINSLYSKQMQSMHIMSHNNNIQFDDLVGKCTSNINDKKILKDLCQQTYVKDV